MTANNLPVSDNPVAPCPSNPSKFQCEPQFRPYIETVLRRKRQSLSLNTREAAEQAGVSSGQVSNWEIGSGLRGKARLLLTQDFVDYIRFLGWETLDDLVAEAKLLVGAPDGGELLGSVQPDEPSNPLDQALRCLAEAEAAEKIVQEARSRLSDARERLEKAEADAGLSNKACQHSAEALAAHLGMERGESALLTEAGRVFKLTRGANDLLSCLAEVSARPMASIRSSLPAPREEVARALAD